MTLIFALCHIPAQDHIHASFRANLPRLQIERLFRSFVALLFLDALQRMFKVAQEGDSALTISYRVADWVCLRRSNRKAGQGSSGHSG